MTGGKISGDKSVDTQLMTPICQNLKSPAVTIPVAVGLIQSILQTFPSLTSAPPTAQIKLFQKHVSKMNAELNLVTQC